MAKNMEDELKGRARAKIARFEDQIKDEVVKEAKKRGHDISKSNVTKITFENLKDLKTATELKLMDFVTQDNSDEQLHVNHTTWRNNTSQNQSFRLEFSESKTDTFSWSITEGFKISYSTSTRFKIPIPEGAGMEVTWNFEFNVSATQGRAYQKTTTWSGKPKLNVAPYSYFTSKVFLKKLTGEQNFRATTKADGKALCKAHIDYWGSREQEFDIPLERILSPEERTFITEGKITGAIGYEEFVDTNERPLSEEEKEHYPKEFEEVPPMELSADLVGLAAGS